MNDNSFNTLKRVKELCELKGWSLYHLASMSDISYSNINNIVNKGTQLTVASIKKISSGFNISLSEFYSSYTPSFMDELSYLLLRKKL